MVICFLCICFLIPFHSLSCVYSCMSLFVVFCLCVQGVSLLCRIEGLESLICNSEAQFIERTVELASDINKLQGRILFESCIYISHFYIHFFFFFFHLFWSNEHDSCENPLTLFFVYCYVLLCVYQLFVSIFVQPC